MAFRIVTVLGARPQFIKAAALSRVFSTTDELDECIVHTGQHFDDNMSDIFFRELALPPPRYNLGIHGGTHGQMTGRMIEELEKVVLEQKPDLILIYGDTNSTLAGALVGVKLHIPVAHVEAGLRSFNKEMPEEINRILSDRVSDLLFCPTTLAVKNLEREGLREGVHHTGDVMYDATLYARESALGSPDLLENLGLEPGRYGICTVHRSENTDSREHLLSIFDYVDNVGADLPVVCPIHPRTRHALESYGIKPKNITLVDPFGYFDQHKLLASASIVLTDSGGLQKEAYFHRVPCITLRNETEWIETVESGWNRLWTSSDFSKPRTEIADYGTGTASQEIVKLLLSYLEAR